MYPALPGDKDEKPVHDQISKTCTSLTQLGLSAYRIEKLDVEPVNAVCDSI
jgi:hypothetical protein